ncbi:hypothetical protein A5641_07840 [Mycobacterium sp. 1554424.7]|nr:hypothetical protein A5641_07840 [Mycobacterium sp. 1554424.7]
MHRRRNGPSAEYRRAHADVASGQEPGVIGSSPESLATQHTVERGLGLAALSELGQRFHAEREMIGLDVEVDTVLVAEPLIKCEMPRPIAIFVQPKGTDGSFGQRLGN